MAQETPPTTELPVISMVKYAELSQALKLGDHQTEDGESPIIGIMGGMMDAARVASAALMSEQREQVMPEVAGAINNYTEYSRIFAMNKQGEFDGGAAMKLIKEGIARIGVAAVEGMARLQLGNQAVDVMKESIDKGDLTTWFNGLTQVTRDKFPPSAQTLFRPDGQSMLNKLVKKA